MTTVGIQAWSWREGFVFVERGLVVGGVARGRRMPSGPTMKSSIVADVFVAGEAVGLPAGLAVLRATGLLRMEAHPDGDVFFADDVDGEEGALEVVAEVGGPALADEVELADEGVGRGEHGGAQGFDEGAGFWRERGAGDEVVGEGGGERWGRRSGS